MTPSRVAVAISTYRRPLELSKLLDSLELASEEPEIFDVIVADNDPDGSAKIVCEGHALVIDYVHEPRPGIVSCRNAALSRVRQEVHKYIAILDDDEWVQEGWLDTMLATMESSPDRRIDVVGGPVLSVLPPEAPKWVVLGGFHQRPRRVTGEVIPLAATNNVLIRTESLAGLDMPFFDQGFADTGGSDSELFWRMTRAGCRLVWCDEALVMEDVPLDRCTARWLIRRAVRLGNVHGRLELRTKPRWKVIGGGVARAVYGFALLWIAAAARRRAAARAVTTFGRGIGMVGAANNNLVHEYAR